MAPFETATIVNEFKKERAKDGLNIVPDFIFDNQPDKNYFKASVILTLKTRTGDIEGKVGFSITYQMATENIPFLYFRHAANVLVSECDKILLYEYTGKVFYPIPTDQQLMALLTGK